MNMFYNKLRDRFEAWFEELTIDKQVEIVDTIFKTTLTDEETPMDYIESLNYDEIWSYSQVEELEQYGWNLETEVIPDIIKESVGKKLVEMSFADDFITEIASQIVSSEYSEPSGYFKDLAYGGCASGMVGMFIYNSDCKDFYIHNIDDIEEYIEILEGDMGPLHNDKCLHRYVWACWLCYEEFGYTVGRELFEDEI